MADALRQLLADFIVRVDEENALAKGQKDVDAFAASLRKLDNTAKQIGASVSTSLARALLPMAGAGGGGQLLGPGGGGIAGLLGPGGSDPFAAFHNLGRGAGGGRSGIEFGFRDIDAGAQRIAGAFGRAFDALTSFKTAMAAFAGGVVVSQIKALVDQIGGIGEEAARLGVTSAEFQRLDVLAQQNATSVSALGTAFRVLGNAAAQPTKETAEAFATLGITVKDASGQIRSRQDLFFETAEALADVSNETTRAALAQDVFGRGATELLPLLSQGSAGIRAQREEISKLPVVSDSAIAAADRFGDRWPMVMLRLKAVAGDVLEKYVLPAMEGLLTLVDKLATEMPKLLRPINFWAIGIAGLVVALSPLLVQLQMLIGLAGGGGAVLRTMAAGFGRLMLSIAPVLAAFLALEDVIVFFMGGKSLTGQMLQGLFGEGFTKHMDELRDAAKDMWGWITGENVQLSGKTSALLAEIGEGLRLMVHDVLAMIPGSGRTAGLEGLRDYEQRRSEGYNSPLSSFFGGINPNDPFYANAPGKERKGDTTIVINNPPPGEAQAIAGQVRNVLDRDRNADLANVQ